MSILDWLKSLFQAKTYPERNLGIVQSDIDNKAPSASVYVQKEVVASIAIPTFKGVNGDGTVRKFPYQYQNGSSSCVAHTIAKITTVLYYMMFNRIVKWSSGFWYTQRSNKPQGGMAFDDVAKLAAVGAITEELLPSDGMSEISIDSIQITDYIKEAADGFSISPYWIELPLDFDTIASTIEQTKKPIMLWFSFGPGEFFYTSFPKINGTNKPWNHSVTAVDTVTISGVQYIVIEDSADYEANYVKYISREFFQRCFLARYTLQFKFLDVVKPKFDGSVKSLQECLIYEKFLASGLNTGFFGELTKQALIKFQIAHNINPPLGNFGPITKQFLSNNY